MRSEYVIVLDHCYSYGNKIGGKSVLHSVKRNVKRKAVSEQTIQARFEHAVLPHLDAAYNLARWLTHNDQDAEDMVQEAYVRAFKFFTSFRGGDSRVWLLTIVRNTCYTWLQQQRAHELTTSFDEELHSAANDALNPEKLLLQSFDNQLLREALEELPVEFREVIILRELEGFSYKEITAIASIPLGTVMSRLARARKRLQQDLANRMNKEL
ncbi:MAG: hypothetical protein NVSMB38_13330 [Ktedonobacteraceae bacterium]